MEDYSIDIGRADQGRTFVRVIHKSSGMERIAVGLGASSANSVAERLKRLIEDELALAANASGSLNTEKSK